MLWNLFRSRAVSQTRVWGLGLPESQGGPRTFAVFDLQGLCRDVGSLRMFLNGWQSCLGGCPECAIGYQGMIL